MSSTGPFRRPPSPALSRARRRRRSCRTFPLQFGYLYLLSRSSTDGGVRIDVYQRADVRLCGVSLSLSHIHIERSTSSHRTVARHFKVPYLPSRPVSDGIRDMAL